MPILPSGETIRTTKNVVVEYKNDCGELVTAFPNRSETGGIGDVVYKRESKD